ncbi:unnamed protein product [Angiostrongylus costaricensis]|uniref:Uncharacterized protein n=1 Tax=Angiostrongylus costaricensis TaxID=334426 RepID=A0A0R3PRS9_ANGCS|nr:unnamed protein product [Angiostrongylus costaricensis]
MWISWFGGFAEPSDYSNAEMPDINLPALIISSIFAVPYLAFLVILPGVREKRLVTLAVFTEVALVGAVLAISLNFPGWTGGSARIVAQFRADPCRWSTVVPIFDMASSSRIELDLPHLSVSNEPSTPGDALLHLLGYLDVEEMVEMDRSRSRIDMSQLYYNENFDISGVSSMASELRSAYLRGLPYPILSIMEYFSLNQDAFDWGRHYRTAGHYTSAAVRSQSSFDSAHSGLRIPRSLSDLTIFKENVRPPRFKDDSEFVLSVTRF